jgi:ferredoxin-type protein NapF
MAQAINLSRRNLFRGRADSATLPLRPPGAITEALFADQCTSCGECVAACPQHIIVKGSAGYPEVDFRQGECTFCSRCIDICAEDALVHEVQPPWRLLLQLGDSCLARRQVVCLTCGDACAAEAIRFRPQAGSVAIPLIDQDVCTGCGACIAACPQDALKAVAHGGE